MAIPEGRLVTMRDALLEQRQYPQPTEDGETFHLSVQFGLAHGFRPAIPRGEITTLRSSTLLSGAYSQ